MTRGRTPIGPPDCHPDRPYCAKGMCRPCYNKDNWSKYHRGHLKIRTNKRAQWLSRYSMTRDDYDKMAEDQGWVCAICKSPESKRPSLSVDHDHACCAHNRSCGKCVRGLLCNRCNGVIARFDDNPDLFSSAALYLTVARGLLKALD